MQHAPSAEAEAAGEPAGRTPGDARAPVRVRLASGLYDRMQALYTGEVKPSGIDLEFVVNDDPRNIFNRMSATQEFDVSEMSCSDYIARLSVQRERTPFIALPVYPARCFRHGYITVNRRRIRTPKDLEGKRIGLPRYTMTATVWMRGILQHEYGVDLSGIEWIEGNINDTGQHGEPDVMPLLRPVPVSANRGGRSLGQMLADGEIDAILGTRLPDSRHENPDVVRLFPDFREREKEYYRRTGQFPIMHCIVIRRTLHERHPALAKSLYEAFCHSKAVAIRHMRYIAIPRYMLPWMHDDIDEIDAVFGRDPFPYGIEAGRRNFETFQQYMVEHGILAAPIPVEQLFADIGGSILT
ncbi:MAG: ABC transporter substrate-binding protein [bacterium]|jgi:4,5-dihydroxyphthalate decarboxylase|nr:ABC transporter substrate-binding protein [Betaproteobacteria bacterium]